MRALVEQGLKQSVSQVAQLSISRVQASICAGVSSGGVGDIGGEQPRLVDPRRPERLGQRVIAAELPCATFWMPAIGTPITRSAVTIP